jgi:hypothetical protein
MSKRRFVLVACAVLGLAGGAAGWWAWVLLRPTPLPPVNVARAEPVKSGPCVIDVYYKFPPKKVAELFRDADAVLWVGLQTSRTDHVDFGRGDYWTIYHFTAWQSAKGAIGRGDSVRVARLGRLECWEPDFPRPGLGEQFVIFLRWFSNAEAYQPMFGPTTTFRVVNGRLQPMGLTYRELSGRKVEDFLRELREGATKRGK